MRYSALLLAMLVGTPALAETTNDLVPNVAANQVRTYTPQPAPLPPEPVHVSPAVPVTALATAGVAAAMAFPGAGIVAAAIAGGAASALATDSFKEAPAKPETAAPVAAETPVAPAAQVFPVKPLDGGPLDLTKHVNTPATKRYAR